MKKHSFTIIIPVADAAEYRQTLKAIKNFNYSPSKIEIILVFGNQPSRQRNIAAEKAKGDILYFLDNDSIPGKNNLNLINDFFNIKNTGVVGGPSLGKPTDSLFQKSVAQVLASFIGSAKSRSRYMQAGLPRESSELELILCNMAIRKNIFLKHKGFNPILYPNEENELINRIKKTNKKIFYHPDIIIFRSHRKTLFRFIKQIFTYGRGRGEQVVVSFSNLTLFPLISLGFSGYIITLFLFPYPRFFIPGLIYCIIIFYTGIIKSFQNNIIFIIYLPVLFFIIHTIYGIGFLIGIIKSTLGIKIKKRKFWFKIKCTRKM